MNAYPDEILRWWRKGNLINGQGNQGTIQGCVISEVSIKHAPSTPFPLSVLLEGQMYPEETVNISFYLSNCNSSVPEPFK